MRRGLFHGGFWLRCAWLRCAWLGLLLALMGCRHPGLPVSPLKVATLPAATPTARLRLAATSVPQATPSAQAATTEATARPTPTPSRTPPPTPTPLPLLSPSCGQQLPLFSPQFPTAGSRPDPSQPLDQVPQAARAAVRWLVQHPDDVALVAYRVDQEDAGIFHNPDLPMPLASVTKLIHLLAYIQAANDGRLDPATWVPLEEINRYYLPGSDLNAHNYAVAELEEKGLLAGDPPALPLEEIPWMMVRHSSNAATDYLYQLLGQQTLEATALRYGLAAQTAPCPFIGQFLIMANHTRAGSDRAALDAYLAQPEAYGDDVIRLTDAYAGSSQFRQEEESWRQGTIRPSLATQQQFTLQLSPEGTARQYAALMATLAQNGLATPYLNILARRYLEWPMVFPVNQALFWSMGFKGGSLPGVLSGVYYAEPLDNRTPVVVAIFYRKLPMATYWQWRRDWPHDELARWLMADPQAIGLVRAVLQP